MNLREHPWKTTLIHLRRHFLNNCEPAAVTYNGFQEGVPPLFTPDGERIWAKYAVGIECVPIFWEAEFEDAKVVVRSAHTPTYIIPYANIKSVLLPEKSELPALEECNGASFYSQRAFLIGHDGEHYEVRGAITANGLRDVYLWHHLTVALRDQERQKRGSKIKSGG